jgi:TPP-dependent pyruvate/acetoin dehydrogenase alpha subunit
VGPGEDTLAGYRAAQEIDHWKARDPLIGDAAMVERYRPQILAEIDAAEDFAERSPWPGKSDLLADVL